MFEVEQKFIVTDPQMLESALLAAGAPESEAESHSDTYYNHPSRNFAQTDEALRVRRCNGVPMITYKGPKQKSPSPSEKNATDDSTDGTIKARREMEWQLSPGDETGDKTEELLVALGFHRVATVSKRRRSFQIPPSTVDQWLNPDSSNSAKPAGHTYPVTVTIDHVAELVPTTEKSDQPSQDNQALTSQSLTGWFAEVEMVLGNATPEASELATTKSAITKIAARLGLSVAERRSYLVMVLAKRGDL